MGLESACIRIIGRARDRGAAHLECAEVEFRGQVRVRLALAGAVAEARGARLVIKAPEGELTLEFEDESRPVRWADKINNPRSRLQKMGIAPDARVWMIGMDDPVFVDEVNSLVDAPFVLRPSSKGAYDAIVLVAREIKALAKLAGCARRLAPKGAVIVLWPKGRKDLRHEEVVAAGREAGLSQTRSMAFNDELTALRLVIARPKA